MDPTKAAFSLLDEFKKFALKGNVVDLAVGVIIGGAFGKIVDSLVKDVLMPAVTAFMPGKAGYTGWTLTLGEQQLLVGKFLGEVMNFLVVALAIFFFIVKFLGWILRSKKQEAAAPPPPPRDVVLLEEIRDLLKAQK